jgi:hypothetical protein
LASLYYFWHAVAGSPAVTGFLAVEGVLAVASVPADPGVPILAGGFTFLTAVTGVSAVAAALLLLVIQKFSVPQ